MFNFLKEREFGDKVILTKDVIGFGPFGDKTLIPKGTICLNYGIPSPAAKYGNSYIELKLLRPIKEGIFVTDRLVLKRNSKSIKNYQEEK